MIPAARCRLAKLPEVAGCEAKLRMEGDKPYVTDNSNYIVDLYFQTPIKDAHAGGRPRGCWRSAGAGGQRWQGGQQPAAHDCHGGINGITAQVTMHAATLSTRTCQPCWLHALAGSTPVPPAHPAVPAVVAPPQPARPSWHWRAWWTTACSWTW
jgi:hypothetical protein